MLVFFLLLSLIVASEAGDLVLSAGGEVEGGADYYNSLYQDDDGDWAVSVKWLDVTADEIRAAETITFPNGEKYVFVNEPIADGDYHSYDLQVDGSDAEADLTANAATGWVEGAVEGSDGTVFLVRRVPVQLATRLGLEGDELDGHLWIETSNEYLLRKRGSDAVDAPAASRRSQGNSSSRALAAAGHDRGWVTHISIKVYYTRNYAWATSDVYGEIVNIVGKTNQGFLQSGTDVQLDLICIEQYSGNEIHDAWQMLEAFRLQQGSVANMLDSADVAMLVTHQMSNGGMAWINWPARPFGIVPKRMAEDFFNFGHEVGHILGGNHNWEQRQAEDNGVPDPPYTMGNLISYTRKYSIMSYPYGSNWNVPINYYAGPDTQDNAGDTTGDAQWRDVVRRIKETAPTFAAIGDESQRCNGFPDCKDLYDGGNCWAWRNVNYCNEHYVSWMATNCRKTCGYC